MLDRLVSNSNADPTMEVAEQGKRNLEIVFRKLFNKPMPQQRLNEIAAGIGINTVAGKE